MESEPLAGQPVNEALLPPQKPAHLWTPGFSLVFVLLALLGIAATLFGVVERPGEGGLTNGLQSTHQAALLLNGVLLVVCLGGLRLVSNPQLRSGLQLRAIVALYSMVSALALLNLIDNFIFRGVFDFLFLSLWALVVISVLGVLSQLRFSYGLAPWQPSDKLALWLQIVLTLGLGAALVISGSPLPDISNIDFFLWTLTSPFLNIAGIVCVLCRPACWRVNPLIVLCLTVGATASLVFGNFFSGLFNQPGAETQGFIISSTITLIGATLFLLGILLIIQQERTQQQGQKSQLPGAMQSPT